MTAPQQYETMTDVPSENRTFEIDILRTIAIFGVMIAHLWFFSSIIGSNFLFANLNFGWITATVGLILFFFLSGYSLMLKRPRFDKWEEVKIYFFRRIKAIYPVYWIALTVAYITESVFAQSLLMPNLLVLNASQWAAFTSGLQIMFFQGVVQDPSLFWFVGTIVALYLIFPILIRYTSVSSRPFRSSLFIISALVFIGILTFGKFLNMLNMDQLFYYYWFFVLGIAAGYDNKLLDLSRLKLAIIAILFFIGVGMDYVLFDMSLPAFQPLLQLVPSYFPTDLCAVLVGIATISFAFPIAKRIKVLFGPLSRPVVSRIARSTYPIYLFHPYFLFFVMTVAAPYGPEAVALTVLFIGMPMAVGVSPYIQDLTNKSLSWVRSNVLAVPSPP